MSTILSESCVKYYFLSHTARISISDCIPVSSNIPAYNMQAPFRLNIYKHTLGLILFPCEIRPFPPLILFVCPCLRGGASAGFSLSLKCERRQSMALPRTPSRTRSKQKKNRQNLLFFKSYLFFYEIRPFPHSILFVCPCLYGGASAGFSLSLKCERRQSHALPRTHSRTRSKKKTAGQRPAVFFLERETRFELATFALARQRSTTEPFPHSGGNNRARTYDPLLVRQMLSQLSYAPVTLNAYIL